MARAARDPRPDRAPARRLRLERAEARVAGAAPRCCGELLEAGFCAGAGAQPARPVAAGGDDERAARATLRTAARTATC
ncbi:MAG: hypothetical protein MZW92_52320 [Comamonadaceae bacterium]|nr:hypothetical protein [Comamonadaceae bacterium]